MKRPRSDMHIPNMFSFITAGLLVLGTMNFFGMAMTGAEKDPRIVPTYECAGIYWKIPKKESGKLR